MPRMMEVRHVTPDEWAVLRDVRLRALADAPHAFASTSAREVAFDEREWRARIDRGPWWLARIDGVPVGLVAAFRTDEEPPVAHLVSLWVDPAFRGSAAATSLVEAALDDVNLGRLLMLVEQLRSTSQLIVITHQKRTMEIADALYGVGMRGDGITGVISQRLRELASA